MSAALVRQALALVDPDSEVTDRRAKTRPASDKKKRATKGRKARYTVQEAQRDAKTPKDILQLNLRKLELIRKHSKVVLNERVTKNIIERAVSRRPLATPAPDPQSSSTAFTEEDFRQFEEEYMQSAD